MIKKRTTYQLLSILFLMLFMSPILIRSYHDVFEHPYEKGHSHDEVSFCGDEIEICLYSYLCSFPGKEFIHKELNIAFTPITYRKGWFLYRFFSNKTLFRIKKGRAPPIYHY